MKQYVIYVACVQKFLLRRMCSSKVLNLGAKYVKKSFNCFSLVRHFEIKIYITRIFLLCRTCHSNDLYSNLKTLGPRDSFENENLFSVALHQILTDVKKDWDDYKEEQHYRKIHLKARTSKDLTLCE